ncbi:MAG: nucleotidyltransferase domain-containing protein [Armatimonadetes bacterium]|nr:nucleotidyltransferase domain-containing protein [Armatimonadota bacterium]
MIEVTDEILEVAAQRLVDEFQPEKVILFGSHAWGRPGPDSDVDLLVILREVRSPITDLLFRARKCLRGLNFPKDILIRTRAEVERALRVPASLESAILRKGKVLYG